jgi:hypothetical protein
MIFLAHQSKNHQLKIIVMKGNFLIAFSGLFLLSAIALTANSQIAAVQMNLPINNLLKETVSKNGLPKLENVNVASKAKRHFLRDFPNVSDERWYEISDGYVVKFISNGIQCRANYDKKGNWLYTIRSYEETNLSKDVRAMVKSTYYDYAITFVQEIKTLLYPLTYLIHMEGKKDFIILKISDLRVSDGGEMEEWQRFKKLQ